MQGWMFITINPNGSLGVDGIIMREITTEKFLCRFFLGATTHSRVVTIAELETYHLFQNKDEKDSYLDALRRRAEEEEAAANSQPGDVGKVGAGSGEVPPPATRPASNKRGGKKKGAHPKGKPANPGKPDDDFLD